MSQAAIITADVSDEVSEVFGQEQFDESSLKAIKKKSISGAASYLTRTVVLQGIGLVANLILGAYLSVEDWGIYGYVNQIIGLLVFFSDVGLAASLVQKKTEPSLADYRSVFTVQQLLSWMIVVAVGVIVWSGFAEAQVGRVGVWILWSLAISFPLTSLKTISSIMLERKLEFSKLVIPQIVEQLVFQGILIVMAMRGFGAFSYVYAILARSLMGLGVMWLIQPWQIGLLIRHRELKNLLGFGVKFQLNDFLARVKDQFFFLVLGSFMVTKQEFGYISWAKQWSMYPYNLTVQNVMAVTFPTFSRLQAHPQALKKAIDTSIFFISLAIFPLLVGMALFIEPMVAVLPGYTKWQPALLSFVFFTLSIAWAAISTPLTNTLNAIGEINQTLKLMVMWTVLTWVLTPLFWWWWGFEGVSLAALVISGTSVLPVYYVKRRVPIAIWDHTWRQLVAALTMAAVGWMTLPFWSQNVWWLMGGMMVVGSVYLLVLGLIGGHRVVREVRALYR